MPLGRRLALVAGVAAVANTAFAQPAGQKITGPVAVYWMSAQTHTGFGMPAGGRPPSASAMMNMMMGGGGAAARSLTLQLGSSQTTPAPAAEHLPPAGLGVGQSLPLLTPKAPPPAPETEDRPSAPKEYQRPRGRMLIFWGCGQHARPGQPIVIDFSQLDPAKTAGEVPPGFAALAKGLDVRRMQPPSPGRNRTYGEWPNEKTRTQVPPNASLVGEHTVQGNYSPTIRFTLDEQQDFLGPLNFTTNAKAPGGWGSLGWNLVGNAQGYLATAIGGGQDTVVMWTSSETQTAAFAVPDYLATSDIARLVAAKALMGPATRACEVPKEVLDAAPQALVQLVAYGGDANFVYPPRPSDPKAVWNQQWAAKVRYRSATGGLLGMAMPGGMAGGRGAVPGALPQPGQAPSQRPSAADILKRGILGGALPFPH